MWGFWFKQNEKWKQSWSKLLEKLKSMWHKPSRSCPISTCEHQCEQIYLWAQSRRSELWDDRSQQTAGVGDQVWREQLHLLPQTLPHWQHHNHQHLLQYLPETGHAHQVLLRLEGEKRFHDKNRLRQRSEDAMLSQSNISRGPDRTHQHSCPPVWHKMAPDVQHMTCKIQKLTWLSFSIWATSRGKRWARAESFSVLTCLTSERRSTSPSYAMGRMEVSLTEVLHRADITAASRRLLDVRKLASAMSWNTVRTTMSHSSYFHLTPKPQTPNYDFEVALDKIIMTRIR